MSNPIICMTLPSTSIGKEIKKHVYDVYYNCYGACVSSNPDIYIYIQDTKGICAAFGVKFAKNGKLFSESYLCNSVEDVVQIPRERIVEVSNCISLRKGYGGKLYKLLASVLDYLEVDYALVTLTDVVQRIFSKLNFEISYLCDADSERIEDRELWGSFYATKPRTYAFDIKQSANRIGKFRDLSEGLGINIAHSLN